MDDLISSSFKKYKDQVVVNMEDIESGKDTISLDKFFEDVESIKEEIINVDFLYKKLQESKEQVKNATNGTSVKELRERMDDEVDQVLDHVKNAKGKLESLEKANAQQRNVPGCGPGSSADKTRTSVVCGFGKKFKEIMDEFQGFRSTMKDEYKETLNQRYFSITGEKPSLELVENFISTGNTEAFLHKAIDEQGKEQVQDAISETQDRHDAMKEMEKSFIELYQMFTNMLSIVEAQKQLMTSSENDAAIVNPSIQRRGVKSQDIWDYRRSSLLCLFIGYVLVVIVLTFVMVVVLNQVANIN